MGKKLYCGNLGYNVSSNDLDQMFAAYGTVKSAEVINDRDTGRSKGFGFVEMQNDNEALAAISGMNGNEHDGRTLTVNEAKPREARTGGGGGGYRGGGGGGDAVIKPCPWHNGRRVACKSSLRPMKKSALPRSRVAVHFFAPWLRLRQAIGLKRCRSASIARRGAPQMPCRATCDSACRSTLPRRLAATRHEVPAGYRARQSQPTPARRPPRAP